MRRSDARRTAATGRRAAKNDAEEGKGKERDERGGGQKEGGEAERAQAQLLSLLPFLPFNVYDISFRRRRKAKRGGRREAATGRRAANEDAEEGKGKEGSERGVRQKEGGEAERAQAKLLSLLPFLLYTQICMTSPSCGGGRVRGRRTGRRRELRRRGREVEMSYAKDKLMIN